MLHAFSSCSNLHAGTRGGYGFMSWKKLENSIIKTDSNVERNHLWVVVIYSTWPYRREQSVVFRTGKANCVPHHYCAYFFRGMQNLTNFEANWCHHGYRCEKPFVAPPQAPTKRPIAFLTQVAQGDDICPFFTSLGQWLFFWTSTKTCRYSLKSEAERKKTLGHAHACTKWKWCK